ncbi:hypothetical protein OSB04_007946 [Centaurea solstitialis]|uniref:Transmembrane protein n=1 Tax=Centaurea solstitialis TaxID=347529 RepID=A0AA38TYL5_9ASTR|nr:hypothetical protein OSB04_007946 [Centaurea solstitialis]
MHILSMASTLFLGRWWSKERKFRKICWKVGDRRHRRQWRQGNLGHVWECGNGWHHRDGRNLRLWSVGIVGICGCGSVGIVGICGCGSVGIVGICGCGIVGFACNKLREA